MKLPKPSFSDIDQTRIARQLAEISPHAVCMVLEFILEMKAPGKVGILRIVGGKPLRFTLIDADADDNATFDAAFPKGGDDAKSTP